VFSLAIAFLLGVNVLQILPDVSITEWVYLATIIVGILSFHSYFAHNPKLGSTKTITIILQHIFVFLLGSTYVLYHANLHLANSYPATEQKKPINVIGKITSLPNYKQDNVSFNFAIKQVFPPFTNRIKPGLIHLVWNTKRVLQIGQEWQFTVRLKKPRGFANVGCFDAEKYYFSKRIIATGYVVTKHYNRRNNFVYNPKKLHLQRGVGQPPHKTPCAKKLHLQRGVGQPPHKTPCAKKLHLQWGVGQPPHKTPCDFKCNWYNILDSGYKLRQYFHDHIVKALSNKPFQGIILALVTGDQHQISAEQFEVFKNTGVEHLLAIAGLHIGFMAGLVFILARKFWCYMPDKWLKIPAPLVGAIAASITALGYAYLAGFSISTQRACIMVVMAMLAIILRRMLLPADIFAYALILMLLLDPFSVLSLSFWLSFTAVAILLYAFVGNKTISKFDKWIKSGLVITIGMMPLLLAGFSSMPLISPLANFIAIPWVSWLVLPASLFGALVHPFWQQAGVQLWSFAELALQWLWPILKTLHQLPSSQWQPIIVSPWYLGLAFIGSLWLLAPRGFPGRIFGLCGFFPLLFPLLKTIPVGTANFTILDVGQGLAIVLETSKHLLVYDTGPRSNMDFDAGEQVVWPFLRANNIRHIDTVIVSHADIDHSGGMNSLMDHFLPQQILTPKPELLLEKLPAQKISIKSALQIKQCLAGQHWQWDGVEFTMLHPQEPIPWNRNEQSCVLHIQTKNGSILLTGDIGSNSEQQLITKFRRYLPSDIIVVPHHGSKYSSTFALIESVKAKYAVASVGYLNQYRHPHHSIVVRYLQRGTKFLDTAKCGAIFFSLENNSKQFQPSCYRIEHRRVWRDQT
jgi:competence protein ComEC